MTIVEILSDEQMRRHEFPVTGKKIFLAHAGVAPLPRIAADALRAFAEEASENGQESGSAPAVAQNTRKVAAALIGASENEIALLGPTSLGLNLVANGLEWRPGDEVVFYADDYPANVYPWSALTRHGVTPIALRPDAPGVLTWDVVEAALSPRTRLVALASCHFLSGYRIDVDTIGRQLHERGILFSLDAIQTLGAFPVSIEHVDFLSADSHKWLLGPVGAGIFYVKASRFDVLRPTLLGSWNVVSPNFAAQPEIDFYPGARRYEPGSLNLPGIVGMAASIRLILELGVQSIAARILELRRALLAELRSKGYELYIEACDNEHGDDDTSQSGIVTVRHPGKDMRDVHRRLRERNVEASLRENRKGDVLLRFSPHFYNTDVEIAQVARYL